MEALWGLGQRRDFSSQCWPHPNLCRWGASCGRSIMNNGSGFQQFMGQAFIGCAPCSGIEQVCGAVKTGSPVLNGAGDTNSRSTRSKLGR